VDVRVTMEAIGQWDEADPVVMAEEPTEDGRCQRERATEQAVVELCGIIDLTARGNKGVGG